ncbi:MAG: alpha/beta hydrolase [Candidatus Poribacteria bacterium]|nr:alpha/beta hydrolase [Candidatus Poribacteria bacterium]
MKSQDFELSLDGFKYVYRVYPNTESKLAPIVILGGVFESLDSWEKHANHLNQFAPVIVADLPGSGYADALPADYSFDFCAEALLKLLDTEHIAQANIFSVSYSTPIVYRFSQLYRERVNRLAIGGSPLELSLAEVKKIEQWATFAREKSGSDLAKHVIPGLICRDPKKHIKRRRLIERAIRSELLKMSAADLAKYESNLLRLLAFSRQGLTGTLDIPAVVFTGEYDLVTNSRHCKNIALRFRRGVSVIIKHADHFFHIEQFQTTLELIMDFFLGLDLELAA